MGGRGFNLSNKLNLTKTAVRRDDSPYSFVYILILPVNLDDQSVFLYNYRHYNPSAGISTQPCRYDIGIVGPTSNTSVLQINIKEKI